MRLFLLIIVYLAQQSYQYQNTSVCSDAQYFDTTSMNCANCPTGSKRSPYSDLECICLPTYKKDANITGFKASNACTQCSSSAVSSDGYSCLPCPSGISIDSTTGDCSCGTNSVVIDVDETGSQLTQKLCVTCQTGAYPGSKIITTLSSSSSSTSTGTSTSTTTTTATQIIESPKFCKMCSYGMIYDSNGQCICDTAKSFVQAADACVLQTDINTYLSGYNLDNIVKVNFENIIENEVKQYESITSYTFRYYFYKFAIGCLKFSDMESCQGFANLCILALYDESSDICKLYKEKSKAAGVFSQQLDPGWYKNFPWLYFESNSDAIRQQQLKMKVSFKETLDPNILHYLPFYLAKFNFQGQFLGIEPLENQFILCPHSTQEYKEFLSFGKKYKNKCSIYLDTYLKNPQYFYELYLKDIDGTYVSIPIKIQNFKNNYGVTVNQDKDTSKWRYVKRFTLQDPISGISQSGSKPSVVRYAKFITLRMEFSDISEKIYRPILVIEYAERRDSGLQTSPQSFALVETEYQQSYDTFKNVTTNYLYRNSLYNFKYSGNYSNYSENNSTQKENSWNSYCKS